MPSTTSISTPSTTISSFVPNQKKFGDYLGGGLIIFAILCFLTIIGVLIYGLVWFSRKFTGG
jgi:hypothetical protein